MKEVFVSEPLLSREMIGREPELARLTALLQNAAEGQPHLVFIAGEAGVGKSRLWRALVEREPGRAARRLLGQAVPAGRQLPFGPVLDALRRYYSGPTTAASPATGPWPAQARPIPGLEYVTHLLPELAAHLPVPTVEPPRLAPGGTPAQQQQHHFHYFLLALQTLAQAGPEPLVLVLEDIHWADDTTLELLAYLMRQLAQTGPAKATAEENPVRLLITATYRSEDLPECPALARLLVQLNRERQLNEIKLHPLTPQEHARMLAGMLGKEVSPQYAALFYERDEGNPFFAEELLGALSSQSQSDQWQAATGLEQSDVVLRLPLSLTASITERVAALPAAHQEVLAYAAVMGREFDSSLLAELAGLSERELVAALRRAIGLYLISETGPEWAEAPGAGPNPALFPGDRYQFRHALTREIIYADMLARERRNRHRAVALALAARPGTPDHQLARHFALAGMPEEARPYALREAERARQVFAFAEERYYLQMALTSLAENDLEGLDTLYRLGQLSLAVMDVKAALDWFDRAKSGYHRLGRTREVARVITDLALLAWLFDPLQHARLREEQEAAAQALYNDNDPGTAQDTGALSIYSQAACGLALADQHARAAVWLERSLNLAARLEDPARLAVIQMSVLARGVSRADRGDHEGGLAEIRQVLDFALRYSLPDLAMLCYGAYLLALIEAGRSDQAEELCQELSLYESRSGLPPVTNLKGWHYYYRGEWDTAVTALRTGIAHVPVPTVNALYRVALAHLLIARGELAEARQHLASALPVLQALQFTYYAPALWGYARLEAALEHPAQAEAYYEQAFQLWKTTDDQSTIGPILLDGLKFYADRGKLWKSRQWLNELEQLAAVNPGPVVQGAGAEGRGVQAAVEGAYLEAGEALEKAIAIWSELKRPYHQMLARLSRAALWLAPAQPSRTDRARAEEMLQLVEIEGKRLQVAGVLEEVERLRRDTRLEVQSKRRATLEANRQPFEGLTRREVEVLVQLSAGLTNREIAAALQIAEGTVELHVSRILGKLGVESRTRAATYALERNWVKPHQP